MRRIRLALALATLISCGLTLGWPPVPSESVALGTIQGVVRLQGRVDMSQVEVGLDNRQWTILCRPNGYFEFEGVAQDVHTIEASMVGYLTARREVQVGQFTLPDVTLLGGDVCTDGPSEERVDVADLALAASIFNTTPPQDRHVDLNDDNIVDIYDLAMIGANFGKTESPWPD